MAGWRLIIARKRRVLERDGPVKLRTFSREVNNVAIDIRATAQSAALDHEVADWCRRGFILVARGSTSAQLKRPRGPIAAVLVVLLAIVIGAIEFMLRTGNSTLLLGAFGVGATLILVVHYGMPERHVYLMVSEDGSISAA